jgi:hypothetical protein
MNRFRFFLRRKIQEHRYRRMEVPQLLEVLKTSDLGTIDMIMPIVISKVRDIRDLMVVVYDDHNEYPYKTRLMIGVLVLSYLANPFGGMYLPGSPWYSLEEGRFAYLMGLIISLPVMQLVAIPVVSNNFHPHERREFFTALHERHHPEWVSTVH